MINLYVFLFFFNIFFIFFFTNISKYINLFDKPDKTRKFHKKETACIGGFIIFINLCFFIIHFTLNYNYFYNNNFILDKKEMYYFFFFSFFFFIIGFIYDKYEL